jgi:predicted transposase YbfD/YdcC
MKTPELPLSTTDFARVIGSLRDPRKRLTRCKFTLPNLLIMAFVSVICGADSWEAIGVHVAAKQDWWVRMLGLAAGRVPKASCFKRVLPCIQPAAFAECFEAFVQDLATLNGAQISLDGKALRGSWKHGTSPLKLVHAWVVNQRVLFAQQFVEDGDELGAMKALIARLNLTAALVSVDAGGASKPLARLILKSEADYSIAIKGNQRDLHEGIALRFLDASRGQPDEELIIHQTDETRHGRREIRTQWTAPAQSVPEAREWPKAQSVIAQRRICESDGTRTEEWRYFIASVAPGSTLAAGMVRAHWSVENQLNWILDVAFDEDKSRLRDKRSQLNFATLRRFALTVLARAPKPMKTISVKNLRAFASMNDDFLLTVLLAKNTGD